MILIYVNNSGFLEDPLYLYLLNSFNLEKMVVLVFSIQPFYFYLQIMDFCNLNYTWDIGLVKLDLFTGSGITFIVGFIGLKQCREL